MITTLLIFAHIAVCVLIADFLSGLFHWAEDSYDKPEWPIIGPAVIVPNLLHHDRPRAFLANSWYRSADVQVFLALWSSLVLLIVGFFTWRVALVLTLVVNANEFHKWAHRTKSENGRVITWLQAHGILQTRAHHGQHHGGKRNSHYCSITPWMNPLLDGTRVWRAWEAVIVSMFGIRPRAA